MLEAFYPDFTADSAYLIDYEAWYAAGIRGVLFDIDNTLVPHGAPADGHAIALFEKLRGIGLAACLISNNQLPRVKPFADAVGAAFIEDAHKPSRKSYLAAMELMGTQADTTLFVGDQLFTDVYGARRAGMKTILVKPIHPKEEIQIRFKRHLEKIVLYFYRRQRKKEE